jgi:hypothetical protein
MAQKSEKIITEIIDKYKGELNTTTIIDTTIQLMRLAEQYRGINGAQKKQIVIKALLKLVEQISDEDDASESRSKIALEQVLEMFIPSIIDNLITLDNGQLTINPKCSRFLSCCK